jgi:type I restriction-modification system DNA methylase subunit
MRRPRTATRSTTTSTRISRPITCWPTHRYNDSDWRGELLRNDKRWAFGTPPAGNANFARVQHFIHHLAPTGTAGFVRANGSMWSDQSGEGEIRKAIVEADLVHVRVTRFVMTKSSQQSALAFAISVAT